MDRPSAGAGGTSTASGSIAGIGTGKRGVAIAIAVGVLVSLYLVTFPARAHVVYITEEDTRGDWRGWLSEVLAEPYVLAGLATTILVAGVVGTAYVIWRPFTQDVHVTRSVLESYHDLVPWLLRLGFGLPLIGAAFTGDFFNPIAEPVFAPAITRLGQLALGFMLLFGLATRFAALVSLGWYLVSLPFAPDLVFSPEWIPGLLAIALLGSGRPSADQVLEEVAAADGTFYGRLDPVHLAAPSLRRHLAPATRLTPSLVRVGLGLTFMWLALIEKLLAPAMAADVVERAELTDIVPVSVDVWILGAGLAELALGAALVVGLFTRFSAFGAVVMFTLALFAIPDDPVLAHIGLFAMASSLLITGAGPWSIDGRLRPQRRGRQSAP